MATITVLTPEGERRQTTLAVPPLPADLRGLTVGFVDNTKHNFDLLVQEMDQYLPRIVRLALPDAFPHKYGAQNDLLEIYGLMPHQIAASVSRELSDKEMVA